MCTGAQKAEVHGFFMRSIARLKGTDRELPQVSPRSSLMMERLMKSC
jgi:hypothetical protein